MKLSLFIGRNNEGSNLDRQEDGIEEPSSDELPEQPRESKSNQCTDVNTDKTKVGEETTMIKPMAIQAENK